MNRHGLCLLAALAGLTAAVGGGQPLPQTAAAPLIAIVGPATPVRIGQPDATSRPGGPFTFAFTNTSNKPIAGVIVAVSFLDAAGKGVNGPTQITAKSLVKEEPGLEPGEGMTVKVMRRFTIGQAQAAKPPARAQLSVDYVLFMDGTSWGPNTRHESARLEGMRSGAALERERLATLLKEQGPAALAKALEK